MGKYSIKETLEALDFAFSISDSIRDSLKDNNRFDWYDVLKFRKPAFQAQEAINGAQQIPNELGDLDKDEKEQIKNLIKDRFDLPNNTKEEKIEDIFVHALSIYANVVSLVKAKKAA